MQYKVLSDNWNMKCKNKWIKSTAFHCISKFLGFKKGRKCTIIDHFPEQHALICTNKWTHVDVFISSYFQINYSKNVLEMICD